MSHQIGRMLMLNQHVHRKNIAEANSRATDLNLLVLERNFPLGHYLVISCFSSASRVCFCYPHFSPLLIISWLNLNFKKVLSMPTFIIIILSII